MEFITKEDFNETKRFKLNFNQLKILFSLQYLIVKEDLDKSKGPKRFVKRQWLQSWAASMHDYLGAIDPDHTRTLYSKNEIKHAVTKELTSQPNNKTWYPVVILEATLFIPYTVLRRNKVDDKAYGKLKFTRQTNYVKKILGEREILRADDIDQFEKAYKKVLFDLDGGRIKRISHTRAVLAMTSLAAKLAAMGAEKPRTAIIETEVDQLKGPALMSAYLAAAGGGAVAIKESGMTPDAAAIVGGGVLLGLEVGEKDAGPINYLIASSPDFILVQAARLEVVVKEIILNKQNRGMLARDILGDYEEEIKKLKDYIQDLSLKGGGRLRRNNIKELEKSLEYMQKAYMNMSLYTSYYNIGMGANTQPQ